MRRRASLTGRAIDWAIAGLTRRLQATWRTLRRAVVPRLDAPAGDEPWFAPVHAFGADEHLWHDTPHGQATKGPTMLTGMVDLTRDRDGRVHARLLDLVPGRSGSPTGSATA